MSNNEKNNEKCTDDKIKINDYISINKDNLYDYLHIGWEKLCDIYIHNLISKGREYSLSPIITDAMNATMYKESDHDHTEEKKSSKFFAMMLRNKKQIMTAATKGVEKVLEQNFSNADHYIQECLLENLGSLRKLIIHRLFCNIVEGLNNEQCYNEYVAMGSTNITSDYDLTIKGSTSNNVMWKMFVKFIDLYGVTLPYAFDTNLYSSPLHLYTQPECLNVTATKKVPFINPNLKKQGYYLEYDTKNFTFVPSNKDEIDMELQFAFLKLSEADSTLEDSTQYSEIQKYIKKTKDLELNKNYVFATEFEKMKQNKDVNDCFDNLKITDETESNNNKRLIMDYKKQYDAQDPVQKYIYTSDNTTYQNKGKDLFKNSNTANYWSSEAYYTSSACNTIIIDIQMNKGKPYMLNKYRKKAPPIPDNIIKKIYLCSAIENLADMIHHIDSHLDNNPTNDDVMLTLIKFSKYLYRFYYSIEAPNLTEWNHNERVGNYKITIDDKGKEKIKIIKGLTHSILLKDNLIPRRKDQDKKKATSLITEYFEFDWKEETKNNKTDKKIIMDKIKKTYYGMIEKELKPSVVRTGANMIIDTTKNTPAVRVRTSGTSGVRQSGFEGGKKRTKKKARKKRRRKRSKRRRK